jgi:hypothetical protein
MTTFMLLGSTGEPYDVVTDIDEVSTRCIIEALENEGILPKYQKPGSSNFNFNVLKGVIGEEEIVITVNAPNEISIMRCREQ